MRPRGLEYHHTTHCITHKHMWVCACVCARAHVCCLCACVRTHTHTYRHTQLRGRCELEQGQLARPESSSWVLLQIISWQPKWSPVRVSYNVYACRGFAEGTARAMLLTCQPLSLTQEQLKSQKNYKALTAERYVSSPWSPPATSKTHTYCQMWPLRRTWKRFGVCGGKNQSRYTWQRRSVLLIEGLSG